MILNNSMATSRPSNLGWWLGIGMIAGGSIALLTNWCASCRNTSLLLPLSGIFFALILVVLRNAAEKSKSSALSSQLYTAIVLAAGVISVLPLGLMVLGVYQCWVCLVVWVGVVFVFIHEINRRNYWLSALAMITWIVAMIVSFSLQFVPSFNLEAHSMLMQVGMLKDAPNNGPEVGTLVPSSLGLPKQGTILVWTECSCPLDALQEALSKFDQAPLIICRAEKPEMKQWSPKSRIIVSADTMQALNVLAAMPHVFLTLKDNQVIENRSVQEMAELRSTL